MPLLSRRHLMLAAGGVAAAVATPRLAFAQAATTPASTTPAGPFKLPALPYPTNALEPHIDAKTMELHNTKHHQAFITNLNNFAKDTPAIAEKPVEDVLGNLASVPEAIRTGVRNNMGGHANHSMFW